MNNDLHTKYRPKELEEVLGHEDIVASIGKTLDKKTCRAFTLIGPSGVGKTTLARIIARRVKCEPQNLVEVDAATHTGIDAMRSITENLSFAGLGKSATRVVVVDEAHALSKSAWQSLLKVVEEPPPGVYFVFCTTEGTKIPTNIRTRCNVYELRPVHRDKLYKLLKRVRKAEGLEVSDDVLDLIAAKSDGSPRQALTNLSLCAACETRKQAASLLAEAESSGDAPIELCRGLMAGLNWGKAMKLVKSLEGVNVEGVRIVVVNYFQKVALDATDPKRAGHAVAVIQAFSQPYPPGAQPYPLILSLASLLLG